MDKAIATDEVAAPSSVKKKSSRKSCHRHIATQTIDEDFMCLQPMTATSLIPYYGNLTTPPASSSESSDIEIGEVENSDKMEWMFMLQLQKNKTTLFIS